MAKTQERRDYEKNWREVNKERNRASKKKWDLKHRAEVLEYRKTYRSSPGGIQVRKNYGLTYYESMSEEARKTRILNHAKQNAKKSGREFSITKADMVWNVFCPVFGTPLNYGKPKNGKYSWDTPSIDRTDPSKGYIPGNVVIMSWRANMLKCDGTLQEFASLLSYLSKQENQNG